MTAEAPAAAIPTTMRTRVGTGSAVIAGVDQRTAGARRFRELHADLTAHVGSPTVTQDALIRRACGLIVWAEAAEAKQAAGEDLDVAAYTTAVNSLHRLMTSLGLKSRARDITPSLAEIMAAEAGKRRSR